MLKLYFSPGACSMASHIGLEETGAPYEEQPTLLGKGENRTEAYLKINPKGKVPAVQIDGKVLTENTAILTYLAKRFPEKKLLPTDLLEEARCISTMTWFSNTVHTAYAHYFKPERYVEGEAAAASVKQAGKKAFFEALKEVDSMLQGKQWIMGDQYTVADAYALVFYGWGVRAELPMTELAAYTAWKERMLKRPTVRKILESEGNVLVKPG
jgi:glutathione S-transferase